MGKGGNVETSTEVAIGVVNEVWYAGVLVPLEVDVEGDRGP